jgi:hypothetical protein
VHNNASELNWVRTNGASKRAREHQHRIGAKQREQEYQLCNEKMVIACEDVWAQRQLMNVMLMAMLNKNEGENVTQSPTSHINDEWIYSCFD